jgi:RNA polymerase sigma factor (sigma-70 family)
MKEQPDEALAGQLAAGRLDDALVAEAYRRFFPVMFQAAAGVLGRELGQAEDVAQETLSRLLLDGSLRHLRDRKRLKGFLAAAAKNAALDLLRSTREQPSALEPDSDLAQWVDEQALADERDRSLARLARVLSSLPTEEQAIINARFFREQSIAEIARELGCSYSAAAQRLSRAIAHARKKTSRFSWL